MLSYKYRRLLNDNHLCDDLLTITIDPEKVDLHHLAYVVVPMYAEAFGAYLVEYFADSSIDVMADADRRAINLRSEVNRIDSLAFYDHELCSRAFGLTPADIRERLDGTVEHVALLGSGVYYIGSLEALRDSEEARLMSERIAETLRAR